MRRKLDKRIDFKSFCFGCNYKMWNLPCHLLPNDIRGSLKTKATISYFLPSIWSPVIFVSVQVLFSLCCFVTVQVVKNTWAPEAEFIEYYSDEVNDSIPTIDLGVPNTEVGKTCL